jgi:hypothetical protein
MQLPARILPLAQICDNLIDLQRKRRFAIKQQSRAERSVEAFLARLAGYHTGLAEADRKKLMRLAKQMRLVFEKDPDWVPPGMEDHRLRYVSSLVVQSAAGRAPWDEIRRDIEDDMRTFGRQLPVWPYNVKGVSELGLAVVIGEAGNLSGYDNPAKLWKRLGLAVIDGRRQGRPENDVAEEWIKHGYNRQRRAEVWAFFDDVMFRAQWRGAVTDDDDNVTEPAHPIGPYGEVYGERKAWNLARGWVPAHADKEARRYMTKRFLRELWKAWQAAATASMEPAVDVPPSAEPEAATAIMQPVVQLPPPALLPDAAQ